jgi:beta-lactamase class A
VAVAALVAGAIAAAPAVARSQARPAVADVRVDTLALRRALDGLAAAHRGVTGWWVRDLETGATLGTRADEPFPTASLVKVPIAVAVMELVEQRELALDDELGVLRVDKVPGAGVLQFLHNGLRITVRDALYLMLAHSDNTATNLLLGRVEMRRVGQAMERRGLPRTKVHAKVFRGALTSIAPDSSAKYGLGVSTPAEMGRLFTMLADGRAVSPASDSLLLALMDENTDHELLQRTVSGVRAPHKTGATDSVRTECALFFLEHRVVACAFTRANADIRWVLDSEPQLLLGRMGAAIVAAWPRRARTAGGD